MIGSQPSPSTSPIVSADLPTEWGKFTLYVFLESATNKEHALLTFGTIDPTQPVLARVHSSCLTGDALFSQRCDCGAQLELAMQLVVSSGSGVIVYLQQEGRNIGLYNKIRAYSLQDTGADTVEANEQLGFVADNRDYSICKPIFAHLSITTVRLMTNNPHKINALKELGLVIAERVPLITQHNPHNTHYLAAKAQKMGHWL